MQDADKPESLPLRMYDSIAPSAPIEPVHADAGESVPPGMRRIRDLVAGDRLIEDDGSVVEVRSAPDTFGGKLSVPVRVASGLHGIRRWPASQGDNFVQLAPPPPDE